MKRFLFLLVATLLGLGVFISCNNENFQGVNEEHVIDQVPEVYSSNIPHNYQWVNGPDGRWQYSYGRWIWVEEVPGWDGGGPNDGTEETDHDTGNDDETGEVSNLGEGNPVAYPPLPMPDFTVSDETYWSEEVIFPDHPSRDRLSLRVHVIGYVSIMFKCEFLEGDMDYRYSRDKLSSLKILGGPSNRTIEYIDWDGDEDFYEFHYGFWATGTYNINFQMPNGYTGGGRVRLTIQGS